MQINVEGCRPIHTYVPAAMPPVNHQSKLRMVACAEVRFQLAMCMPTWEVALAPSGKVGVYTYSTHTLSFVQDRDVSEPLPWLV